MTRDKLQHISAALLLLGAALIGCDDDSSSAGTAMTDADAGADTSEAEDTGEVAVDTGGGAEDTSVDAPVVEPVSDRTLVEQPLLGDTPLDNRFSDPSFQSLDARHWFYVETGIFGSIVTMQRNDLAVTPTGMPTLSDPGDDPEGGRVLLGMGVPAEGAMMASVWIGDADLGEQPPEAVLVGLIALGRDGVEEAVELTWGDAHEDVGGIRWWRAEAVIEEPKMGFLYLSIEGINKGNFHVHAPVLVDVDGSRARLNPRPTLTRELRPTERAALERLGEVMRSSLKRPEGARRLPPRP